jgi:hypothetical protein
VAIVYQAGNGRAPTMPDDRTNPETLLDILPGYFTFAAPGTAPARPQRLVCAMMPAAMVGDSVACRFARLVRDDWLPLGPAGAWLLVLGRRAEGLGR